MILFSPIYNVPVSVSAIKENVVLVIAPIIYFSTLAPSYLYACNRLLDAPPLVVSLPV